ncbi:MAG: hypothetical protein E6G06_21240 [Actinobacteria bacterium]|nr:MAG: hypothetical protein E6G06_21240 [Actinomycetota bacterium]
MVGAMDQARRPSSHAIMQAVVTVTAVGGAVLFVLVNLKPHLLLANTTPAGGDMGAHVWGPAYLRDHLLPHGRITGWTPDWYAGFPALVFYFPLPSLLIAALDVVLPYGIAFKLVAVSGLVTLPVSVYIFGRLTGMRFPGPPILAVATVPFLFDRFHTIWGGNIASALAGEFAFAMALSLAFVYLGVLARGLDTGRHRALAAVLLACTGLCHMIPTLFALAGTLVLLVMRFDRRRLKYVAVIASVAAALAAFWVVPFVVRNPYTTNMGWERTTAYVKWLFPWKLTKNIAPSGWTPIWTSHMEVVTALALAGTIAGVALRRRTATAIAALAAIAALGFRLVPEGPLWNARLLPFWYLCLYLLAGVAVAEVGAALTAMLVADPARPSALARAVTPVVTVVAVLGWVALPLWRFPSWVPGESAHANDNSFIPGWARWNFSGYERKPAYPEYRRLIDTMDKVGRDRGCGRAMWEYDLKKLDSYGTPMSPMLLPYWTKGCIGSMEGLFFESAGTTPYHFLNQSELSQTPSRAMRSLPYRGLDVTSGVQHLQLLGVRYYLAFTSAAVAQADADPDLRLIARSNPWKVYEVAGSAEVVGLRNEPAVVEGIAKSGGRYRTDWLDLAVAFYQNPQSWDVPLAIDGPKSWPRVGVRRTGVETDGTAGSDIRIDRPARRPVAPAKVSAIRTTDDRISFDVDRPGTPVLVKASYFPNWKASGAKGPWRVTPNLMVVIPTQKHVSLHYGWTVVDGVGWLITLGGLAAVVVLVRRGSLDFPQPEPGGVIEPDHGDELTSDLVPV